ncbi:hypothetical protein D3C77_491040 [compost metagenome]
MYPGLHEVDLNKVRGENYALTSVFSREQLPYIVDANGQVYVDYAWDIMQAIDKSGSAVSEEDGDLRVILSNQSYFVPVKSLPYAWLDGAPVPQVE